VAVELDVAAMKVGEPDVESLRALFAELEFSFLLKELLPVIEVKEGDYREIGSKAEFDEYLRGLGESALALAIPAEDAESIYAEERRGRRRAAAGAVGVSGFAACGCGERERGRKTDRGFECAGAGAMVRWKTGRSPIE
jgi:hypothetical protein